MSSGFQPDGFGPGFQQAEDSGAIAQTLPSLTQAMQATTEAPVDEEPGDVLGRAFLFRPPRLLDIPVRAQIRQTLPSLTQSMTADVNDDELVLLLV